MKESDSDPAALKKAADFAEHYGVGPEHIKKVLYSHLYGGKGKEHLKEAFDHLVGMDCAKLEKMVLHPWQKSLLQNLAGLATSVPAKRVEATFVVGKNGHAEPASFMETIMAWGSGKEVMKPHPLAKKMRRRGHG